MILSRAVLLLLSLLLASCATGTIAQLKDAPVDLKDEKIDAGLDKAIQNNQLNLEKIPVSQMTPESILRLADLKIKKEYDFAAKPQVMAADDVGQESLINTGDSAKGSSAGSDKRAVAGKGAEPAQNTKAVSPSESQSAGTREAIALYKKLLTDYPNYDRNDHALYQLGRIYEELGNAEEAMKMLDRLAKDYPHSRYIEEVQFRRGEYYYARKQYLEAKDAYKVIVSIGAQSSYYELSLYKLGWTFYKQEMYEEGMHQFVALLDHKVATGYDLDHPKDAFDEKRLVDTYSAMSLSFSYLGGADAVAAYFGKYGRRTYETGVYKNLGDYYLEKRRYSDAAATYKAFSKSNPNHKMSPRFDMWATESYRKGGFSKLVIEADKDFVSNYGLKSVYWTRLDIAASGEVSGYVKTSLAELVHYYHALYQDKTLEKNKDENFLEAVKWYREFLNSFPKDGSAPAIHNQFAELLLENKSYSQAAVEYEHVAYDYPANDKSADAGYTAIYAMRKNLEMASPEEGARVKREVVRSSLKFAETFPRNSKTTVVVSAAVDDIYSLKDYSFAAVTARKMVAIYSGTEPSIRRSAWLIFAHSSFELGNYTDAEEGYQAVLDLTAEKDASRADVIENLAASFYKQGEKANKLGDYKTAATYFLLVGAEAPTAKIRAVADFDGIAALIQSKNLVAAADALRSFRTNYPGQAQSIELTKKLALAYRETGELPLAAAEYERLATDSPDAVFQRASLELAADLYVQAKALDKAYPVYRRYVSTFPKPLEYALEMRTKIAAYLKSRSGMKEYLDELKQIMDSDASGGSERTDRTRYLGAKAALDLAELTIKPYSLIKLENPYAENLRKKQAAMMVAKEQLEKLFDYETDIVTAAATYYLAEMYYDFSRALMKSERPYGLAGQEKEQYELSLEEQAFPFEEKAIQVHQKNLDLMSRGIYNIWIEKSIEKLAKIMPGRYAKVEESSDYIDDVNNVLYANLLDPERRSIGSTPVVTPGAGFIPAQKLSGAQKTEIDSITSDASQAMKFSRYEKVVGLLNKIIALSPGNPVPYVDVALVYEKMKNLTLAEESFKQAVKIDPDNPVANNEFALLYRKTARFGEARKIYERILDKYPNFVMAQKNLGILCDIYMKDYKCALEHYAVVNKLMPSDKNVAIWVADMQKRAGGQ